MGGHVQSAVSAPQAAASIISRESGFCNYKAHNVPVWNFYPSPPLVTNLPTRPVKKLIWWPSCGNSEDRQTPPVEDLCQMVFQNKISGRILSFTTSSTSFLSDDDRQPGSRFLRHRAADLITQSELMHAFTLVNYRSKPSSKVCVEAAFISAAVQRPVGMHSRPIKAAKQRGGKQNFRQGK